MSNWRDKPTAEVIRGTTPAIENSSVQTMTPKEVKERAHDPAYLKRGEFFHFLEEFTEPRNMKNFAKAFFFGYGVCLAASLLALFGVRLVFLIT